MVFPQNNIPNDPFNNQQQDQWQGQNPVRDAWRDAAPKIALRLALAILIGVVLFVLVRDLAGFGSFAGLSISEIFEGAGIDPRNRGGFENFLFIALLAGAVWIFSKFFGKGGN